MADFADVVELRPPCHRCGAPGLTAFCPMTDKFIVLRAELTDPAAKGREWVCGGCLVTAVTELISR